jgi:hypothetical protein
MPMRPARGAPSYSARESCDRGTAHAFGLRGGGTIRGRNPRARDRDSSFRWMYSGTPTSAAPFDRMRCNASIPTASADNNSVRSRCTAPAPPAHARSRSGTCASLSCPASRMTRRSASSTTPIKHSTAGARRKSRARGLGWPRNNDKSHHEVLTGLRGSASSCRIPAITTCCECSPQQLEAVGRNRSSPFGESTVHEASGGRERVLLRSAQAP